MIPAKAVIAGTAPHITSEDAFSQLLDALLPDGHGLVAMIEAYFDETGTHHGSQSMCVAGYLFTAAKARRFNERWQSILQQAGLQHFRMSECAGGAGQFKGWPPKHRAAIEKKLIALIREHATHGVGVWLTPDEFNAEAPPWWHEYYGGAYTACLMQCVVNVIRWANHASYQGPITYFFEAGDEHAGEANTHMNNIVKVPEQRAAARYVSHSFMTKDRTRLFDAADALAWVVLNRTYLDAIKKRGTVDDNMRPAWRDLVLGDESFYTVLSLRRKQLKAFFASQKPPDDVL